ncbi:MAG: hypothetical protein WC755_09260 [Candidatus Woesearchaeota archaeon]|jgi:hypothetical protein
MENTENKVYEVLYERELSEVKKVVAHIISFAGKTPMLAIQQMYRASKNENWKYGKMSVLNEFLLDELIKNNVFEKAQKIIKSYKK